MYIYIGVEEDKSCGDARRDSLLRECLRVPLPAAKGIEKPNAYQQTVTYTAALSGLSYLTPQQASEYCVCYMYIICLLS